MEDARANGAKPPWLILNVGQNMGFLDSIIRPKKRSLPQAYDEAASAIENFVDDRGGPRDWDDWVSIKEDDPFLESVRPIAGVGPLLAP